MSIGTGVVLFVIGAILVYAVNVDVQYVDLDMIGYILMAAGVVVFLVGIVMLARRRRTESVTRTSVDPVTGEPTAHRTTSTSGDGVL